MNTCPVCGKRIQDWEMASGKVLVQGPNIVHKACTK